MRTESTGLIIAALHLVVLSKGLLREECKSRQYVTLETVGVIQCFFQADVYGVLWYHSADLFHNDAILSMENSVKSGKGFLTGEFDIYPNGSLVINNVSVMHEGKYTVVKLQTLTSDAVSYSVNVSVIAKTFSSMPVIAGCDNRDVLCFQIFSDFSEVSCTVYDARPLIPVEWKVRTTEGDNNIPSSLSVSNASDLFYTSRVTTNHPFVYTSLLTLLVCKADSPPGLLQKTESLVLVQYEHYVHPTQEVAKVYFKTSSKLELKCSNSSVSYFVWQVRRPFAKVFNNVLYTAILDGNATTHIEEDDYKLRNSGALVVDTIKVHHEGLYRCISGNGLRDAVAMYDIAVVVFPNPPHLIIEGCNHQQYCVLEVKAAGSLKCTVKSIRPQVELDFRSSSELIHFYEKKITVEDNGDTFDISVISNYRFIGSPDSRTTVECGVINAAIGQLYLSTKLDLLFLTGPLPTEDTSESRQYIWKLAVAISVLLIIAVLGGLTIIVVKRTGQRFQVRKIAGNMMHSQGTENDDENIPLSDEKYKEDQMNMFLFQLKAKYQDLYDAIQPIPYIRDRLYCVERVFVEGGIEYLAGKEKIGGKGIWKKLNTYQDILNDDQLKSVRRIVEGEPGYGKSTLTLQLVYDWCQKVQTSYLTNIDILILLRLRQLGGISSIYKAIKRFLLPKDSKLKESDIENLMCNGSNVLVILDGFDEYPDHEDNEDTDVINIIRRTKLQHVEVIITTRSSCLPKGYPGLTKRIKLTGFDDNARSQYIQKAVAGNDIETTNRIKQRLKENPVLRDLCQVPLFFVMFAHMSHENEQFQMFKSVTSFFLHMIWCFHSHAKNKMKDENVAKYDLLERNHKELDKLAFEGLSGKNQQLVWGKEELCKRLTHDFYNQYVRIGILVEEEVLDDDPSSNLSEYIQYKTKVRFYHKLFCEWYAAHYLSEYVSKDDFEFEPWQDSDNSEGSVSDDCHSSDKSICRFQDTFVTKNEHSLKFLDPCDLQYVYRFACGLNPIAAEKIISYLSTRKDTVKFAVLCILENSGNVEHALQNVKSLCSKRIDIEDNHHMLLQRSTIQLLEIASANEISISLLYLSNCCSKVDSSEWSIQLKSNLSVPVLRPLKVLVIEEEGEEIPDITGFIQYSERCPELEILKFLYCMLPQSVQTGSFSVLRSRKFKVWWGPRGDVSYRLNLASGLWERTQGHGTGVMTNEDYRRETKAVIGE